MIHGFGHSKSYLCILYRKRKSLNSCLVVEKIMGYEFERERK